MLAMLGLSSDRYYAWVKRQGLENKHNGLMPKSTWLTPEEKEVVLNYHRKNPRNGYRRLCYMMLDEDIVACSPRSVHRILNEAGVLDKASPKDSSKGKGFEQPQRAHEHWHVDISYLNICGTFYYLCSVLDGWSRFIVHHEIRERMTEQDVEQIIQTALELHPTSSTRVISDRGPQFIAKDFKTFVRLSGLTHVMTSPYYPQSNGKIERWHRELKETIRPKAPSSLEQAQKIVAEFVEHYNYGRLHSALGYVTPYDKLLRLDKQLFVERKHKLEVSSTKRKHYWAKQDQAIFQTDEVSISPYGAAPQAMRGRRQEVINITGGEALNLNRISVYDEEILLDK